MSLLSIVVTAAILPQLAFTASIPQSLQRSVPRCAWSCLSYYIRGNFPTSVCSDASDVDCLCSHTGVQGFTLQEGAFVCAHQHCDGQADEAEIESTYDICNGRPGAIAATHTLLPTAFTAKATSRPSSTSTSQSSSSSTSQSSSTSTPQSSRETSTTSTSSAAAISTASPSGTPQHGLQTSQIIGISVACAATAIVGVCLAILLVCMRRRRRGHQQLDSGKLSYEEFKPPSVREKSIEPGPTRLKDPRGGPGGVGVAPVRYKAILPPADLFSQQFAVPVPATRATQASNRPQPTPLQASGAVLAQEQPVVQRETPTARLAPDLNVGGSPSAASSHYSVEAAMEPSTQPRSLGSSVARPPSVLLPGRHALNPTVWDTNGRESSASQFTQFEEDAPLPSATIPASIATRPLYPPANSSESTVTSLQSASCTSSSSTPSFRKSRGPSLKIDIPGKRPTHLEFPPPPPRREIQAQTRPRPTLADAGAASRPFVHNPDNEKHTPTKSHQQYVQGGTHRPTVTVTSASPPAQFPTSSTGRLVAQGPGVAPRKDSVSRRGFSQPNATAYAAPPDPARPSLHRAGPTNPTQLTVNGERINYPTIPRPTMSPPLSAPHTSPPKSLAMPLPPPPPGPHPHFAGARTMHGHSSSHTTTGSTASSAGSLLAKRRGSDHAAALGKQLLIHDSHGSTSHKAGVGSLSTAPHGLRGAGHGRVDSKAGPSPPEEAKPATAHPQRPAATRSPPAMNVRQWPTAPHTGQGGGSERWRAPQDASQQLQQYVAYQFPPPPPRPGAQTVQPPLMSPTPAQLTPTRRGGDMYLSVQ